MAENNLYAILKEQKDLGQKSLSRSVSGRGEFFFLDSDNKPVQSQSKINELYVSLFGDPNRPGSSSLPKGYRAFSAQTGGLIGALFGGGSPYNYFQDVITGEKILPP